MKKFIAFTMTCGAIALSACADVPPCASSNLDCNTGAYSEERTYRDNTGTTSNINHAPAKPAPAPAPVQVSEPVTEVKPAPAPEPVDTQIMQKADQTPAIKSAK